MVEFSFQSDLVKSLETIRSGGILLYPTDTVWGLGCDATNHDAVNKLLEIKGNREGKAFIVLLDDPDRLHLYVRHVPEMAYELMELSPKPLTLIFDQGLNVDKRVMGADGSLAVRCVKDDFCRELIRRMNKPLVSTSANIGGTGSPAVFDEIREEIKSSVDYIVGWRQQDKTPREPSSLMRLKSNGEFEIIRK